MGEDTRFEFCSEPWVAVANAYLRDSAKGVDLAGIEYTFSEVFTNAPAHLNPDASGRVGWYFRISNNSVEAKCGIPETADASVEADYESIVPLARTVFEDNPDGAAAAGKVIETLTAAGTFKRENNGNEPPAMPWAGQLHDVLASRTL